jgi:hypothetical protein
MQISLNLPDAILSRLQGRAENMDCTLEEAVLRILDTALEEAEPEGHLEEIVQKIKSLPSDPKLIRPAQGSLKEALLAIPEDLDFDPKEWERQWDRMEAEMRKIDLLEDIAERIR